MGAEVAVASGTGSLVLDARRGDGLAAARDYTFPALVTTQRRVDEEPQTVAAAVRALVRAQQALKENPGRATDVGKKLFPEAEAGLIAELIRRDAPFYDPAISRHSVDALNAFSRSMGLLTEPVAYEQVVATEFQHLWKG
jgi:ABC-type nitrate/sulfonate/bicarbonate transport system substrate-binding protein